MVALALAQFGTGAVITALLHPFGYAKVLMQVDHEPLPPATSTTFLFRQEIYEYPNIFRYIAHIRSVDGFTGLYRGVVPRIMAGTLGNLVQYSLQDKIKLAETRTVKQTFEKEEEEEDDEDRDDVVLWLKTFAKETSEDTLSRCTGIIVSHPFHVVMVRSMVQFIGRETKYDSVYSSVIEIYNHEGILGFFVGLVPRLLGEVITIWMTSFLAKAICKYCIQEKEFRTYTIAACNFIVSNYMYPFTLVTNIMITNKSGLAGGQYPLMPAYTNWVHCMRCLSEDGELKRGASIFWRSYKPRPTIIPRIIQANPIVRTLKRR